MVREFSVSRFDACYPHALDSLLPPQLVAEIRSDSSYIIRLDEDAKLFELGYRSDRWRLK